MKNIYRVSLLFVVSLIVYGCALTKPWYMYQSNGKLLGVLPLVDNRVVYQEKVDAKGLSKAEIFKRARRWWIGNYRSAKDVFQLVDKETGEIVGKGIGTVYAETKVAGTGTYTNLGYTVRHVISVDIEDGSYLITVSGLAIEHRYPPITAYSIPTEVPVEKYTIDKKENVISLFKSLDEQTMLTIASIKDYIKKPTAY